MSDPILHLAGVADTVSSTEDYSVRAVTHGQDELGGLIDAFNHMLRQIQRRDEALIIARDKAEEVSRTKSAFLANMSHELRTPLNAVIGYSEMLQEELSESGQRQQVADLVKIHSAGKHLLGLINDILDLSKIEAGKMTIHAEAFEVPMLLQDVMSTIQPLIEKNGNTLALETGTDLGDMNSDVTRIRQVLLNLLSNASKFTSSGKVASPAETCSVACPASFSTVVANEPTRVVLAVRTAKKTATPRAMPDSVNAKRSLWRPHCRIVTRVSAPHITQPPSNCC